MNCGVVAKFAERVFLQRREKPQFGRGLVSSGLLLKNIFRKMFPAAGVFATVSGKGEKVLTTIALRCFFGRSEFFNFDFDF